MRLLILCTLLCLPFCALTQDEKLLLDRYESAVTDSQKVVSAYDLLLFYFSRQPEKAKPYAFKAEEYGLKSGNAFLEAKGHESMLIYYRRLQDYPNMAKRYPLWREAALRSGNKIVIYDAFLSSANFSIDMEMYQAVLPYLNKAAEMAEETGHPLLKARVLYTRAGYVSALGEHGKAVGLYDEAIAALAYAKDFERLADAKSFKAESLLRLWKIKEVPGLLEEALNYYAIVGKRSKMAYCKGLLGQAHAFSGNMKQAVSNYKEAVQLYEAIPMKLQAAQCYVDLAAFALAQQNAVEGDQYLSTLEKLLPSLGQPALNTFAAMLRGVYYTVLKKFDRADSLFQAVSRDATKWKLAPIKAENDLYYATLMLKQGKKRTGDSLFLSYAEGVAATQDRGEIEGSLTLLKQKNPQFPERYWTLLRKLYSKGGVEQIKKELLVNGRDTLPPLIDSLAAQNRFSLNTVERDSLNSIVFNRQLQELETKYSIRQVNDSLRQVKLEVQNEQLKNSRRTWQLIFAISGLLLLGALLWNRIANARKLKLKNNELDQQNNELTLRNETISALRMELKHRIENTIQAITSYVEIKMLTRNDHVSIRPVYSMVKAMGTLHKTLYGEMTLDQLNVKPFLEELYRQVESIFAPEIPVTLHVNADMALDKERARALAVIVSELWTNSFKYAFAGRNSGKIEVSIVQADAHNYKLTVTDDGVGFEQRESDEGLGLMLIMGQVKSGLGGTCTINGKNGTVFEAVFPVQFNKSDNVKKT
ncbi:sensor histidine kinase [Parasegetibacter sp. NRK P23]|uniref:sensor histidine kinase n=1 Tax=Parasegetibacter sp. NRK P23 TaxID=2942999 RepID=UPI0020432DFD|nr:sensor histidine kinase [Parasegetibacter sp. NRK P23]MCM5529987.1 sensor histidine kinase [Parasegetibacter sp. NRK P23]